MENKCPCHGCVPPKRNSECHGSCRGYKEWKASEQVKKDAERKRKEQEAGSSYICKLQTET